MILSRQKLLFDLYVAFYCARRGKSSRSYVRKWERNLKENMEQLSEVHHGVEFLGAFIKPYRTYISNHALHRIETKLSEMDFSKPWRVIRSVNSYLGIFQHTDSYNIRRRLLMTSDIMRYCVFNRDMTQAYDRRKFYEVNPKRGFAG